MNQVRLVFPGFPCTADAWRPILPNDGENHIVPFAQVLGVCPKVNLVNMAREARAIILRVKPSTILCHDWGGAVTLVTLLMMQKKGQLPAAKLVVFNTAFRKFDVFQNRHPFKIAISSWKAFRYFAKDIETEVDPAFESIFGKVRSLYRWSILQSLKEKALAPLTPRSLNLDLGLDSLFIRSDGDPYISGSALDAIERDFGIKRVLRLRYRHFPHSGLDASRIPMIIDSFERGELCP